MHQLFSLTCRCNLLLRIQRPSNWTASEHNHIIWCLYIPDENEDETIELEKTSLLVTTHHERVNKLYLFYLKHSFPIRNEKADFILKILYFFRIHRTLI